jgi:hypothetical protein
VNTGRIPCDYRDKDWRDIHKPRRPRVSGNRHEPGEREHTLLRTSEGLNPDNAWIVDV